MTSDNEIFSELGLAYFNVFYNGYEGAEQHYYGKINVCTVFLLFL